MVSDFAGHGRSLIDFEQGYFGEHDGPIHLIGGKTCIVYRSIIREKYPDSPYFMLGTDLGSILIRQYMSDFGDFIEGAFIIRNTFAGGFLLFQTHLFVVIKVLERTCL